MPRDGSLILSGIREPTLTIVCGRCGRYGRYSIKRLIAAHGADAKLTDLLVTLANCEKAGREVSISHNPGCASLVPNRRNEGWHRWTRL